MERTSAALWGIAATFILGALIVVGSRNRAHFEAAQAKTEELEEQLQNPHSRLEPRATGPAAERQENRGPVEEMLQQLRQLDEALIAADLASWQTIHERLGHQTGGQSHEHSIGATSAFKSDSAPALLLSDEQSLDTKVADVTDKLYNLQQLAYNLWALREIQAAEENNDNWDVRLAPIDAGLLHPTVAALYSSTYADQIKGVEEPLARAAKAQHVLITQKIGLSAF